MENNYFLWPQAGTFDIASLESILATNLTTFRDPEGPEIVYWFSHNQEYAQAQKDNFAKGKRMSLYSMGTVLLRPEFIRVDQETTRHTVRQMSNFLVPIIKQYRCVIINEYNLNVTERYRDHPERLFDPGWTPPDVEQAIEASEQAQQRLWQERAQAKDTPPE